MAASVTTGRALRYARGSARGLLHQALGHGQFTALLHSEGHGVLFTTGTNALPEKKRARQNLRRTKLILDAIKYNMWVPQSMRDEVNRPPDENPRAPDEDDDGKAPF